MRETELKAVVDSWDVRRRKLEHAGATLLFAGRLEDRRYDTPDRALTGRDEVLRLRIYRTEDRVRAELGWKGQTLYEGGYKVREELRVTTENPLALAEILQRLGFIVIRAIDRQIIQYEVFDATVRFERYPRMDDLVEVEGEPAAIERAIAALGLPRHAFTTERLPEFAARYRARTGNEPALCDDELTGAAVYSLDDA